MFKKEWIENGTRTQKERILKTLFMIIDCSKDYAEKKRLRLGAQNIQNIFFFLSKKLKDLFDGGIESDVQIFSA